MNLKIKIFFSLCRPLVTTVLRLDMRSVMSSVSETIQGELIKPDIVQSQALRLHISS